MSQQRMPPTKYERVKHVVMNYLKDKEFTVNDVLEAYAEVYPDDPIPRSTVSTYLSRMATQERILRRKTARKRYVYEIRQPEHELITII